jgi:hypothetical protein
MKIFFIKCILLFSLGYSIYYYFFDRDIQNVNDICHIYERRPHWESILNGIENDTGVSKFFILSVIRQESSFDSTARPPFKKFLGFIPYWERVSSSYGYSQAVNGTWDLYKMKTKHKDADRTSFSDSVTFMAWYFNRSENKNGLSLSDYKNLYLSYHEGWGGFNKKTHLKKSFLPKVTKRINKYTLKYKKDFNKC